MSEIRVSVGDLPPGTKKVVKAGQTEILLINHGHGLAAVQAKCPHAGAPLEEGAICNGKLICPWHMGTFALPNGEVLEPPPTESLKTYSVRIEGDNIWVNSEPLPLRYIRAAKTFEKSLFLLVGLGAAGYVAATTLRQSGFEGKIVAIDPEAEEPVDRTQLSKDALGGPMPIDEVRLDYLATLDVERLTGTVIKFSAAQKEVQLNTGQAVKFDKALVATGGKPERLEIPGAKLAFTIRHSENVRQILRASAENKQVVIIGTSFIGLEAASALVQRGLAVTVVGREKIPFARQFGDDVALVLKQFHESHGVKFRLGVEILQISKDRVTILDEGAENHIAANLVIMGVGVTPELSFEHDLPLAEDGGIKTDSSLQAAKDVWVAGDIANVGGSRIEHWRVAQQHGRIAALAMLELEASYSGVPFFWTYHFGKRFGYLGRADEWDQTFVKGDLNGLEFIVFYVKSGRVEALLNCGFESKMAAFAEIMRNPPAIEDALRIADSEDAA